MPLNPRPQVYLRGREKAVALASWGRINYDNVVRDIC
jgi:hypothetical protein